MLFLMLPLAFAFSIALSYIPNFQARLARLLRRFFRGIAALLCKTAGEDSARLMPAFALLFMTAIACILTGLLEAVHPLLCAPLVAPFIPLPGFIRDALDVREALEEGVCTTDAERSDYEQRILAAVGTLAQQCAQQLFVPLLLATLLLPLHLSPATFCAFYALRLLDGECAWTRKACMLADRVGDALMVACVIPTAALCGTEMGMAARARKLGAKNVLLSAVGVDPALKSGHRPVTGDISQSCLCVCVALTLLYTVVSTVMFLSLVRIAALIGA